MPTSPVKPAPGPRLLERCPEDEWVPTGRHGGDLHSVRMYKYADLCGRGSYTACADPRNASMGGEWKSGEDFDLLLEQLRLPKYWPGAEGKQKQFRCGARLGAEPRGSTDRDFKLRRYPILVSAFSDVVWRSCKSLVPYSKHAVESLAYWLQKAHPDTVWPYQKGDPVLPGPEIPSIPSAPCRGVLPDDKHISNLNLQELLAFS
ncbi:hypothetical protein B0H11DRAFT_1905837 [Mycena galericulata]|nr:hypothetical protein B0H11DRAFT_1905837 [Mycena galericulata]